jgi:exonuclease VII small subunit
MTPYYALMSDYEIIGHTMAIPDSSELSQALAEKLRRVLEQRDQALDQVLALTEKAVRLERECKELKRLMETGEE